MKKPNSFKMELVKWTDIVADSAWHDADYKFKPKESECYTLGFVVMEDDRWLTLADSLGATDEDCYSGMNNIPKGVIVSRKVVGSLSLREPEDER